MVGSLPMSGRRTPRGIEAVTSSASCRLRVSGLPLTEGRGALARRLVLTRELPHRTRHPGVMRLTDVWTLDDTRFSKSRPDALTCGGAPTPDVALESTPLSQLRIDVTEMNHFPACTGGVMRCFEHRYCYGRLLRIDRNRPLATHC